MTGENYLVEHYDNNVFSSYADTNRLRNLSLHIHNYYEMNLFLEGDIVFFINERRVKPKRGMLFFIDNTQIHGPQDLKSDAYVRSIVHFNPQIAKKYSTPEVNLLNCFSKIDYRQSDYVILNEEDIKKFVELTKKLDNLSNNPDTYGFQVLQEAYLIELLVLANRQTSLTWEVAHEAEAHSSLVQDIMLILNEHRNAELSLQKIGQLTNMNPQYINRVFKKETGVSIYKYFLMKKVSYAKRLLLEGYAPKEVAVKLSYKDYSTFLRAFKKVTGVSPRTFYQKNV